jgi:hypothetical protein
LLQRLKMLADHDWRLYSELPVYVCLRDARS